MGPKIENLELELEEKLDHDFKLTFHGKSNYDSLNALKRCLGTEMAHKGLVWAKNRKI